MLIGVTGKKGAGKDTFAKRLIFSAGYHKLAFAGPLKDMMRALGLSNAEVDGDLKEEPCSILGGRTPRHAMQTLGTEWGRQLIHPNLWLYVWQKQYKQLISRSTWGANRIIVPDVRFNNEAETIKAHGGIVVEILRPSYAGDEHTSEKGIDAKYVDEVLSNHGSFKDFKNITDDFATRWSLYP